MDELQELKKLIAEVKGMFDPSSGKAMVHALGPDRRRLVLEEKVMLMNTILSKTMVEVSTSKSITTLFTTAVRLLEGETEDSPRPPQDGEESHGSES